eukprot:7001376-Pyramimonas_sp.AAC.1
MATDLSWAPLGAFLGPSCGVLSGSGAISGLSWAALGPSWGPLGPSWNGFGRILGRAVAPDHETARMQNTFKQLSQCDPT